MNADQIKRNRHVRRSYSSETSAVRLAQVLQRHPPTRTKSSELPPVSSRVIKTRPELERQVSGLGMEDPVIVTNQLRRGLRPSDLLDMDDAASVSIASDPTANEENEGIDMALFHASLSMGDSTGLLSLDTGNDDNIQLDEDDELAASLRHDASQFPSRCTIHTATSSSPHRVKPHLIFPPRMVDLQASIKSINIDDALAMCQQLDAEEMKEFQEHQQQTRLERQVSLDTILRRRRRNSSDKSSRLADHSNSSPSEQVPSLRRTDDTPLSPSSGGFSPRRTKRTVRKLHVSAPIHLEDMANALGRNSPPRE